MFGSKGGSASRRSVDTHAPATMLTRSDELLRVCSLLLLVAGSRQLKINEFFVPPYVESGESAELHCTYGLGPNETEVDLFVKWWWTPGSSSPDDRKLLYQRIAGHPAEYVHLVNSSQIDIKPNDTIVLRSVSPADSGVYECEVSNIEELRQNEKLVVFQMGTGPMLNVSEILNTTENNNSVNMMLIECTAEDVSPKPEISVSIEGKEVPMSSIVKDVNKNGVYSIFSDATLSSEDLYGSEVRCELFYTDANITHPPYVDTTIFVPAGYDPQLTTEVPEDATEPDATPESYKNPSHGGIPVMCSWYLLVLAIVLSLYKLIL